MPTYFATTARGIEPITAVELKRLGATNVKEGFGGVSFDGDRELLYRACLWTRTATKILVPLREFAAKTPEMLYDQVRRVKWESLLDPSKTFAVDCTIAGAKSLGGRQREGDRGVERDARSDRLGRTIRPVAGLNHSRYAALKIKDAVVDQLRMKQGARPNVDVERPDLRINAYLSNGRCALSLDAAGSSLHERGYRLQGARAPMKENLAAAILLMTGWDTKSPFIDPMCGSGTLALEAALIALDIAPGLFRESFGFFGWPDYDASLWAKIVEEARSRAEQARTSARVPILGFDQDREAVANALENSKRAGLSRFVHFERRSIDDLRPVSDQPGVLVVNPPYGERLGEVERLKGLYAHLGDLFKQRMKGWNAFIFTGNLALAKSVGLHASRRIVLFNGPIECRLLKYELY